MQPIIGITSETTLRRDRVYSSVYNEIARAVEAAGGLPLFIPTQLSETSLRQIHARLDALLLPGGPDVNPARYGAERHPRLGEMDDDRDAAEIPLAQWAVSEDKPVFGICRGHQMLNVALGGTLFQDMPSLLDDLVEIHAKPDYTDRHALTHEVKVAGGSRLSTVLGESQLAVNSLHHQAVERVAPGMQAAAWSPDGVIEATEMPGKSFVLSVQWHPEDLYLQIDTMRRLFEAFVEAARVRMLAAR